MYTGIYILGKHHISNQEHIRRYMNLYAHMHTHNSRSSIKITIFDFSTVALL